MKTFARNVLLGFIAAFVGLVLQFSYALMAR